MALKRPFTREPAAGFKFQQETYRRGIAFGIEGPVDSIDAAQKALHVKVQESTGVKNMGVNDVTVSLPKPTGPGHTSTLVVISSSAALDIAESAQVWW